VSALLEDSHTGRTKFRLYEAVKCGMRVVASCKVIVGASAEPRRRHVMHNMATITRHHIGSHKRRGIGVVFYPEISNLL
jgi:hypothetical protein